MAGKYRKNIKMTVVILILLIITIHISCPITPTKSQRLSVWIGQKELYALYKHPPKHRNKC